MDVLTIAIILAAFLVLAMFSGRIEGTPITPPMLLIGFGFMIGEGGFGAADIQAGHSAIHVIAELTLILVLFTDAARIDLKRVRRDHNLPVRMLAVGLPLVIVTGTLVASQIFPAFSIWEAALLAAILAPTDAALGQSVVSAKAVPVRIRQAINVESGLNDGIALPAVLLLAALASTGHGTTEAGDWVQFGLMQVILGPLAGMFTGYVGARLLDVATERGWVTMPFQGIGILSLAALTYVSAELIGGNGFIATVQPKPAIGSSLA